MPADRVLVIVVVVAVVAGVTVALAVAAAVVMVIAVVVAAVAIVVLIVKAKAIVVARVHAMVIGISNRKNRFITLLDESCGMRGRQFRVSRSHGTLEGAVGSVSHGFLNREVHGQLEFAGQCTHNPSIDPSIDPSIATLEAFTGCTTGS